MRNLSTPKLSIANTLVGIISAVFGMVINLADWGYVALSLAVGKTNLAVHEFEADILANNRT